MATAKSGMSSNMKMTMRNGTAASAARSFVVGLMSIMIYRPRRCRDFLLLPLLRNGRREMLHRCRTGSCDSHRKLSPSPALCRRRGPEGQRAHDGLADEGRTDPKLAKPLAVVRCANVVHLTSSTGLAPARRG